MSYYRLSLRTLFGITGVVAIALLVYPHLQPETWESGLRASDIQSATVSGVSGFGGGEKAWHLSKSDAIELVRALERCPLTEIEDRLSGCMLPGEEPFILDIKFSLSRGRTLPVLLFEDELVDARIFKRERLLVDVSSVRQQIIRMVLDSN